MSTVKTGSKTGLTLRTRVVIISWKHNKILCSVITSFLEGYLIILFSYYLYATPTALVV